jgi:hypothetical protein
MKNQGNNVVDELNAWIKQSQAEEKSAVPAGDPGTTGTEHPVADADGQTIEAPEGARASENESDVADQLPAETPNEATGDGAEGPNQGQNIATNSIGTEAAATGEDASVETSSVKSEKDDPGTSHPAEIGDEKYASLHALGTEIMGDLVVATAAKKQAMEGGSDAKMCEACGDEYSGEACEKCKAEPKEAESKEAAAESDEDLGAAEAQGAKLAAAILEASNGVSDEHRAIVYDITKRAELDAVNVANYLAGFLTQKAAMADVEMADAMGAEDVMGAASAGDVDDAAAAAISDDAMGADAMGADAMGADAGGANEEALVAELAQALAEAGVTPEEIAAMATEGGAGEAAAAPADIPAELPPEIAGAEAPMGV